jgi:hypothetical protein
MRRTRLFILTLLAPVAVWSQSSGGGYQPSTPGGGYITGGMSTIHDLLTPPPPPSLTLPPLWGKFQCKGNVFVYTTYQIMFTSLIHYNIVETDQPDGPCNNPPSSNGNGGPLSNSNSTDTFSATTGPAPQLRAPHQNAATTLPAPGPEAPKFTALVRALPFPPDYAPSSFSFPACDPATATQVFMVNHLSGTVTRLNSCGEATIAVIPVQSNPLQVAVTPDGSMAIVTSFDNAITFIDTSNNQVLTTISTDFDINPSGIAISPDGTRAYVTSFNNVDSAVLVVDIQQGQIVAQISVDTYPQSIFLSPDGSVAYVTFPFGNLVRLIDTQTGIVFGALQIEETYGVAFNSTGTLAYITSQAPSGSIQVVNTSTYSIVQSIPLTVPPDEIKMTPDDQWLYINSYTGNAGIIINVASGQMLTTTSSAPLHGLAIVQ